MAQIEIRNLTTIFGPRPQAALDAARSGMGKQEILETMGNTVALQDVTLEIEPGEIFVVMGLSGSGKSTLVRHINRLIEPTAGKVLIDGTDVLSLSAAELIALRRDKISMVFQRFGLHPHRTVIDNVGYGLEVRGFKRAAREEKAMVWIERVGLKGYERQYPSQLSGGMQQRVGLARALATDTDIVLMDEAFSALDPLIRSQLQDQLVELQKAYGKTIVFITHDLDEALRIGDKIAILKDGAVIQASVPAEILLRPADDYVREFVRDVNRARALTVEALMKPPSLRLTSQSLDEALAAMLRAGEDIGYVIDDGRFSGVVSQAALRKAIAGAGKGPSLAELAVTVPTIDSSMALESALPTLLDCAHPVPVIDEDGGLAGIVAQDDVGAVLTPDEVNGRDAPERLAS